jgi:hypothetical protein
MVEFLQIEALTPAFTEQFCATEMLQNNKILNVKNINFRSNGHFLGYF